MTVNNKRVFYVKYLAHEIYIDILKARADVRLDRLENDSPDAMAAPILSAAHAYQVGAARDEQYFHWLRRLLEVRKQHQLFGTGTFEVLPVDNPSVLAYARQQGDDIVLCINNLSRFAQPAELPLQRFEGRAPIELLGRVPFPRIGELPYFITLGPYAFYWFQLVL